MRRPAVLLLLSLLVVSPALAGKREWRDKHKSFQSKVSDYTHARTQDPQELEKLQDAVRKSAQAMFAASPEDSVQYTLEEGLSSPRKVGEILLEQLRGLKDERAQKELADRFAKADPRAQILAAPTLAGLPEGRGVVALARELRSRDPAVVLAVVQALGKAGAEAKSEEGKLTRLLRDKSLRLQFAAADALEAITGTRPDGYAAAEADKLGVAKRFWADRVSILVDDSREAGEQAFADPTAAEGKQEPPTSVYRLVGRHLAELLKEPPKDLDLAISRFGRSSQTYDGGYVRLRNSRALVDLAKWFDHEPRERERDVEAALSEELRRDPPPDEVYLFLAGLPEGRRVLDGEALVERVKDLLWGTSTHLHVTAFQLDPEHEPKDATGQDALRRQRERLSSLTNKLAQAGGGRATLIELHRGDAEQAAQPQPGANPAAQPADDLGVDLTKPLSSRDLRKVRDAFQDALKAVDQDLHARKRLADIAACPEPKLADDLLPALSWSQPAAADAVREGLTRNPEPGLHAALLKALTSERDPARRMLLLATYGQAPGADVTHGLLEHVEELRGDVLRRAWHLLSERPPAELGAEQAVLKRVAHDLQGLTSYYSAVALSKASGQPAPSSAGLDTAAEALLPERYVASGVAVLVDTHRDMDAVFMKWEPPVDKEGKPTGEAPPPVSRLDAARHELQRTVEAVALASGKLNVIQLNGRSLSRQVSDLSARGHKQEALDYVAGLRSGSSRDVWTALRQALEDPEVETIHLLVSGLPVRSEGTRDPAELLDPVRELNRPRGVAIEVVLLLGPKPEEGSREEAAETDFLASMEALYRPLAEDSGGQYLVRRRVATIKRPEQAKPNKR